MAALTGPVQFTGSLGTLSAYRMKGTEDIVLRSKSGVSRERIKSDPNFDLTRRNNQEWKACIAAAKNIRHAVHGIRHLADYNYSGSLHALCKNIQLDDRLNEKGKRPVLISKSAYKLEGFGLNRYNTFESIVRHPLDYAVDKSSGTAGIAIPAIIPGINLYNPKKQPLYRFIIMLGAVADIIYDEERKMYKPSGNSVPYPVVECSTWHSWKEGSEAASIHLSVNNYSEEAGVSLILAAGIEYGVPLSNAVVQYVKYAGAGKLLKVV